MKSVKKKLRIIANISFLITVLVSCSSDEPGIKEKSDWNFTKEINLTRGESEVANAINVFSHRLMTEASIMSADGEFCVSPVSVAISLGMLANATAGDVHNQILDALATDNIDNLNSTSMKFMQYLPCDENGSCLSVNNRFWIASRNKVDSNFKTILARYFNAGVESVDFNKKSTVSKINKWIYDNTHGKIDGILDKDWTAYKDTEIVGANTVYFKGTWISKFSHAKTKPGEFNTSVGKVEVPMMHKNLDALYCSSNGIQCITLYFEKYRNAMEIYLPTEGMDITEMVRMLTPEMQSEMRAQSEYCDVTLSMPSFNKTSTSNIQDIIMKLGIVALGNADLSPAGLKTMPVSLLHKTSIKVDEDGAELAAVTAIVGELANVPGEYRKVSLDIDRPFVYIVRNYATGAILMAGAVADPRP